MRKQLLTAVTVIVATITPALAQSSMALAMELGRIIAYEQACGLAYEQDAIVALINERVAADDVQFNGAVELAISSRTRELGDQSESAMTLYCAQIAQTARSFGFIE